MKDAFFFSKKNSGHYAFISMSSSVVLYRPETLSVSDCTILDLLISSLMIHFGNPREYVQKQLSWQKRLELGLLSNVEALLFLTYLPDSPFISLSTLFTTSGVRIYYHKGWSTIDHRRKSLEWTCITKCHRGHVSVKRYYSCEKLRAVVLANSPLSVYSDLLTTS